MRTLFFVDDLPVQVGASFQFANIDAAHAIRVLRMGAGDLFTLSDGRGSWSDVRVLTSTKKSLEVEVTETGYQEALETQFTIVQAIPKGDRVKESVELNTEGGADRIVMWRASRSIGKSDDKIEKLQLTAREASKQSRRYRIPQVTGVATTTNIVDEIAHSDCAIVLHEGATIALSKSITASAKKVLIIIGPEGGLTEEEVEIFAAAGAQVVKMGRPILRSAHAGLAALSAVNTSLSVW